MLATGQVSSLLLFFEISYSQKIFQPGKLKYLCIEFPPNKTPISILTGSYFLIIMIILIL